MDTVLGEEKIFLNHYLHTRWKMVMLKKSVVQNSTFNFIETNNFKQSYAHFLKCIF